MPKYLKAVAMKTEKSTAEHTLMWLILPKYTNCHREHSGSVVECLTRDRGAAGSSLTDVTALWSLSKTHLSLLSTVSTQEDPSLFN